MKKEKQSNKLPSWQELDEKGLTQEEIEKKLGVPKVIETPIKPCQGRRCSLERLELIEISEQIAETNRIIEINLPR